MDLPTEIVMHIFKYLPISDLLAASETCKKWYIAANDTCFMKKKYVHFVKTALDNDDTSPLKIFEDSQIIFTNFLFGELELSPKLNSFWENLGEGIKSLTLKHCDVCEKVFIFILKCCPNLEELNILSCRELFMSGRLMEGDTAGMRVDSLASLKKLSLAGNRYLSDSLFNRFVATAPLLKDLNLTMCALSFHSGLYKKFYPLGDVIAPSESVLTFHFILQFIMLRAKILKKLSFSETLIDGTSLKLISEIPNLELESLELHSCDQLTNVGILSLASHQTNLRELDIGLCTRVTDLSLVHICNSLLNLQYLNIQRCRAVTDLGIAELHKLNKLTSLNISQCDLITSEGFETALCSNFNYTLRDLVINSLNLDERAVILLSEKMPNLRFLDVSYCFNAVTDVSIQAIFKNQVRLEYLLMSHCDKVSDVGLTGMGKIQISDDEDGSIVATGSESSLKIHLGSRAEEEIVRDAQRKRNVKMMCENVSPQSFTGYSLDQLQNLRELDVSGCNRITDVSLTYAFKFRQLVNLNMSRCQQITHIGIKHLVKNCPSVEYFNLIDCFNLTDEATMNIVKGLKRLKHFQLKGCNQLSDRTLQAVLAHCQKIKVLDVQGCRNISPELASSLGIIPTLHTVLMSKPGPYVTDGVKNRVPAPPPHVSFLRFLRLN